MRRRALLLSLPLLLLSAGCGGQTGGTPAADSDPHRADFQQRAAELAQSWSTTVDDRWRNGFVPLQEPTVLIGEPAFTEATKLAFSAGWYREEVPLPATRPPTGTIRFPTGSLDVPLVSAVEAYRQLDRGDPPPCPERSAVVPSSPATPEGPDGAVSGPVNPACAPLTVTAAKLGTVALRTSRGTATVPAWLFTVRELAAPVARSAVAPAAVDEAPRGPEQRWQAPNLLAAQDLTLVDGDRLGYRLGGRPCDEDVSALVAEFDHVVVVAGETAAPPDGPPIACVDMLELKPVAVNLAAPLGDRVVLDALSGLPLALTQTGG